MTTNGNTVVHTTTLEPRKDQQPIDPPVQQEAGELAPPPQPQKRNAGRKPRAPKMTEGPSNEELIALGKLTLHATRLKVSPTEYITAVKELAEDLRRFGYVAQADALKADLDAWAALTVDVDPKG